MCDGPSYCLTCNSRAVTARGNVSCFIFEMSMRKESLKWPGHSEVTDDVTVAAAGRSNITRCVDVHDRTNSSTY